MNRVTVNGTLKDCCKDLENRLGPFWHDKKNFPYSTWTECKVCGAKHRRLSALAGNLKSVGRTANLKKAAPVQSAGAQLVGVVIGGGVF